MLSHQAPWWSDSVIYQIYLRSFQDSNGDGIGDLQGLLRRLEYVDWLGVDTLWLTPFYPSPMHDFGYDITNYMEVDPIFGDLALFDEVISHAHALHLNVLIDFIPNHTSDQHPWFRESSASRHHPRRDWYIWADAQPDGAPPNNWLSIFGGSAWQWHEATEQYYLHSFLKEQPDLNWRNPLVKEAMFNVLRFWLQRGVDGFRIDAAHFLLKDPHLRDNPSNDEGKLVMHKLMGAYNTQVHLYDKGHPDVHAVFREFRALLDQARPEHPPLAIGEIGVFDWQEWASYYGFHHDELHLVFNFGLLGLRWNAQQVRQVVDAIEASLAQGALPNYVLGNHDEPRVASRIGLLPARGAMMLSLTLRGVPTLYYGDELGMLNAEVPAPLIQDPWEATTPGLGRDPARTPMAWDRTAHAGFCAPEVDPWLPLGQDSRYQNVATEQEEAHSMLHLTRSLLALRRSSPVLTKGTYASLPDVPQACFVFMRQYEHQQYLIALNFSASEQVLNLPERGCGRILLSTYLDREEMTSLSSLVLRGHEGCIVKIV